MLIERRPRRSLAPLALLPMLLAACAAGPDAALAESVQHAVDELAARPELAGGRIGVCVTDARGGAIASFDDDRGFVPASNMKLVTAAVALETLPADHTMPTELWWNGAVDAGVLRGELVLRGHGDPTFGSGDAGRAAFAELVRAVRERGVTAIEGRVAGDGTWLGDERLGLGWQWDWLDEAYAPPFGGLCCLGNVVAITVSANGGSPVVDVSPRGAFTVKADVRVGAKTELAAARAPWSDDVRVAGTIAADGKPQVLNVPVRDPAAFAAHVFAAELEAAGIRSAPHDEPTAGEPQRLWAVQSPPLVSIVRPMLLHSDNLAAEQLLRTAARVATGDGCTASSATHAIAVLTKLGVDVEGAFIADGSGLSRRNLLRPRQVVQLLAAMHRSSHQPEFAAGLPVAGRTGTLRERLTDAPAAGRVRAKTGTLARVVCLAGYVPRPDAQAPPLVFCVMLNDFACDGDVAKAAVDAFVQQLARAAGW